MTSTAKNRTKVVGLEQVKKQLQIVVDEAESCFEEYEQVPSQSTLQEAQHIAEQLFQLQLPPPTEVYAGRSGQIAFVWRLPGHNVEAWVKPNQLNVYPKGKPHGSGLQDLIQALKGTAA